MIDLVAQYRDCRVAINESIQKVLESGCFILGSNVAALEQEVEEYLGVEHAVGVASGTDALVLALRALDDDWDGKEVILPVYTFFATAEAVLQVGATPVFVDVDPKTYCLSVKAVEDRITPRTRAVIPVHLYGHPVEMTPLLELARANDLKLIEDNAQAFGAEYSGQKTATLAHVGCLSFYPSKNLGAYGDGGMVVTNDSAVAERVRLLRTHGWRKKYVPEMIGFNSRLDELQAAILRVKLKHVDEWNVRRRHLAGQYSKGLGGLDLQLPCECPDARHVYHLYVIQVNERDRIQRGLEKAGVASAVYYPQPLHLSEPCQFLGYGKGEFPVAERASQETLAIPLYPEMSAEHLEIVIAAVKRTVCTPEFG